MKNETVTRNVITIQFPDGNFLFGMPYKETVDYTTNVQYADDYDSVEDAKKKLELFNSFSESRAAMNGEVKKFSFEIDVQCTKMPSNIEQVI